MPTYGRCQEVGARASTKRSAMQATLSKMIRSLFRMASTFRHKTLEMKHDVPGLPPGEMKFGTGFLQREAIGTHLDELQTIAIEVSREFMEGVQRFRVVEIDSWVI